MFEIIRDVSTECCNFGNLMEAYELLGRSLEQAFNYKAAITAYKKLFEVSWIVENSAFEIRAYMNLARCYFYL